MTEKGFVKFAVIAVVLCFAVLLLSSCTAKNEQLLSFSHTEYAICKRWSETMPSYSESTDTEQTISEVKHHQDTFNTVCSDTLEQYQELQNAK